MKRLLIVSPHFVPTNAADMQRVRLLLPYFDDFGFQSTVLSVSPECVAAPCDPWLESTLPTHVPIHREPVLGLKWCRIPGFGTLSNRGMRGLYRAGQRLLSQNNYDLVYFSTTQFGLHQLGPKWKQQFGVPFVMDYQDPWVNDYYDLNPSVRPPGGRLKYATARHFASRTEPKVLSTCSGITTVSESYPEQLRSRYPFLPSDFPTLVIPFPGDDLDLKRVRSDNNIQQSIFDATDGNLHWVYVGRGGNDMHKAVRGLFKAIELQRNDELSLFNRLLNENNAKLMLHFIGTSYATAGKGVKTIAPIANEYGIEDCVFEHTDRIPYSQTLRCLLDADALIVPGSDDAGYTASKLYPYLLARKPMLSIFHRDSSVCDVVNQCDGATLVTFNSNDTPTNIAHAISSTWFQRQAFKTARPLNMTAFDPYTARRQARQLAGFFRSILTGQSAS